ncbi:uncharacterized protein LOC126905906 [Daktulosphaira vitifoliae]|uniref:uncharacterized protein LOC126905906 n=1 Tax=Daktulosphaira vitifoliae TaxID=58002 RepID=UPI0021AAAD2C|nr:uncharacterized protein LOC126905906 [Daktulosphaira vitifoliae]
MFALMTVFLFYSKVFGKPLHDLQNVPIEAHSNDRNFFGCYPLPHLKKILLQLHSLIPYNSNSENFLKQRLEVIKGTVISNHELSKIRHAIRQIEKKKGPIIELNRLFYEVHLKNLNQRIQNGISDEELLLMYNYLMPGENPDEELIQKFKDLKKGEYPSATLKAIRDRLKKNDYSVKEDIFLRYKLFHRLLKKEEKNMLLDYFSRNGLNGEEEFYRRYGQ